MLVRRLDENGDMSFGQGLGNMATDAEACAQNVRTRLLLSEGEWFLDTTEGMPWLQNILTKPVDYEYAQFLIRERILQTTGINELNSFDAELDHNTRKLTVSASVSTVYDSVANIKVTL
jgi:hypothetical protein